MLPFKHDKNNMSTKLTLIQFIEKAKKIHGDKYLYENVVYVNTGCKVLITCIMHGSFNQTPADHLYGGYGCPKCKVQKMVSVRTSLAASVFQQKAHKKHGNKYDYSDVEYVTAKVPVTIICPNHGRFDQTPNKHLSGNGCRYCSADKTSGRLKKTTASFIIEANLVHNNFYNYKQVNYLGNNIKVSIICPVHGVFYQTPNSHLRGQGCNCCSSSMSKAERIISNFLLKKQIFFIREKTFSDLEGNVPGSRSKPRYDFFIPQYNLLIEYDGVHHYRPTKMKGRLSTDDALTMHLNIKANDCRKSQYATLRGYRLLRIPYTITAEDKIIELVQAQLHLNNME